MLQWPEPQERTFVRNECQRRSNRKEPLRLGPPSRNPRPIPEPGTRRHPELEPQRLVILRVLDIPRAVGGEVLEHRVDLPLDENAELAPLAGGAAEGLVVAVVGDAVAG